MARTNQKKGSILLNKGINVEVPAEYLDESSLRSSTNFEINRGLLRKRSGETELGSSSYLYSDEDETVLLVHFDGDDEATELEATTGQTVTFEGTAQLDTAQKKFGTASLLLDGNSDYVSISDSDGFTISRTTANANSTCYALCIG